MLSKSQFANLFANVATPTVVAVDLQGKPKTFSTGTVGYHVTGKAEVRLPDGSVETLQVSTGAYVCKSKEWTPEKRAAFEMEASRLNFRMTLTGKPKLMESGSCGFHLTGKADVQLLGQEEKLQVSASCAIIGSKEWAG
jgi:hypothetical protein